MTDVTLIVPSDASQIEIAAHAYQTTIDAAGVRTVTLPAEHARILTGSGLECSLPWIEANRGLAEALGPMPKPTPGIHIASYLRALEESRPLHPRDARGTLRQMGVLR